MFHIDQTGAGTVLRVHGEIDIGRSGAFRDAIRRAAARDAAALVAVVLDECAYFDCSGVRVLIALRREIGPRLRIVIAGGRTTHRIFDILRLLVPLGVATTVADALRPAVAA